MGWLFFAASYSSQVSQETSKKELIRREGTFCEGASVTAYTRTDPVADSKQQHAGSTRSECSCKDWRDAKLARKQSWRRRGLSKAALSGCHKEHLLAEG
jgi:hypothetical protein